MTVIKYIILSLLFSVLCSCGKTRQNTHINQAPEDGGHVIIDAK